MKKLLATIGLTLALSSAALACDSDRDSLNGRSCVVDRDPVISDTDPVIAPDSDDSTAVPVDPRPEPTPERLDYGRDDSRSTGR